MDATVFPCHLGAVMKRALPLAIALLLVVPVVVVEAKPKNPCEWKGETDPFTGEDKRRIGFSLSSPFIHGYHFGRPNEDGSVPVEVSITWGVDTTERWREPVKFLLADGKTIVDLVPSEPTAGERVEVPYVVGSEVRFDVATRFDLRGIWARDDLGKIARSEGVARVRFTGPGQGPVDAAYKTKDQMRLVEVARCYFERKEE